MGLPYGSVIATMWSLGYLRQLRREAGGALPGRGRSIAKATAREARRTFADREGSLPDKQGRTILAMCSLVLASYRELVSACGDEERAFQILRNAFRQTYRPMGRLMYAPWVWFSRDPVGALERSDLTRSGVLLFGSSMSFSQEADESSVSMIVDRCAFHQFFVEQGEPGLTRLICAWDRSWMDVIDGSAKPIRTERRTTISTGGDRCRFRFVRDSDKQGKPVNDVVLDQLD